MMNRAFKYRIYPNKEQANALINWLGQTRFIWNLFLEQNIEQYKKDKTFIWKYALNMQLPSLKVQYPWLNAPAHSLQYIGRSLDQSLRTYCKNRKSMDVGFPHFKKKGSNESGIYIPQVGKHISLLDKYIKIPKLSQIKIKKHRELIGIMKSITISRYIDQWYVSILTEVPDISYQLEVKESTSLGIDLGIKSFAVTSESEYIDNPKYLRNSEDKIKKLQQNLARKKKGSHNYSKAKVKLAKMYRKTRFQRKDFLHKGSCSIAKSNDNVFVEDLAVKNMLKNHKLAKAISDCGWSQFITYLEYKMKWKGGAMHKIARFAPSSQLCSECGRQQKMPLSERKYVCPACGFVANRDYNAAVNILKIGMAGIATSKNACGDMKVVSMKQEAATRYGRSSSLISEA
jgi:putative transposase